MSPSDEQRFRRYAERKRFERAIATEVQAERERAIDLLVRRQAVNNQLCRRFM